MRASPYIPKNDCVCSQHFVERPALKWGSSMCSVSEKAFCLNQVQSQYHWHFGLDHSLLGGVLSCALYNDVQHPWPLLTTCVPPSPSRDNHNVKCLQSTKWPPSESHWFLGNLKNAHLCHYCFFYCNDYLWDFGISQTLHFHAENLENI